MWNFLKKLFIIFIALPVGMYALLVVTMIVIAIIMVASGQ